MIITPDFVFLNNPRTGSSFVRKALKLAYLAEWSDVEPAEGFVAGELILPVRRGHDREGRDHHGTCAQIPQAYRHRPVISAVRNPYAHLVSIFELGLWRVGAAHEGEGGGRAFEHFIAAQDASAHRRWPCAAPSRGFGPQSMHFLQMFSTDPARAFRDLERGAQPADIARHVAPIVFLRQERLTAELSDALRPFRTNDLVDAVSGLAPSHVTKRACEWSHAAFAPSMIVAIREREAFLFDFLARRGIVYSFENADFRQKGTEQSRAVPQSANSLARSLCDDSSTFRRFRGSPA